MFMTLLMIGLILSLVLPLRPSESESEKRTLTPFPEFSAKALFNGSYFDNINLWFSDTYPFREALVSINAKINSLYGFGDRIYGLNNTVIEDIPTAPATPIISIEEEFDETLGDSINVEDAIVQDFGGIIVINDAAYEPYSFVQKVADKYAYSLNSLASSVSDIAKVYDILVPTAIDITMPDNERQKYNSSSQADAIKYIFSCLSDDVNSVNVYNTMRKHRTDYIYFRTDHHWTALGAYYAYAELCKVLDVPPTSLTEGYTEYRFDGFKGSFYADTNKNPSLGNNPDTIFAYDPKAETTLTYYTKDNKSYDWDVVRDVTGWNSGSLYSTFIGGDNPYTFITNNTIQNDKKCLVVKESFGNAMVPFIVSHYSEVHVIDYRYWNGRLSEFINQNGIDDVIFINNISATRNTSLINKLSNISK